VFYEVVSSRTTTLKATTFSFDPRSASSRDFIVPRTRTKFGDRGFSVAGLTSLSESVRSAETLASFKRNVKKRFVQYLIILTGFYNLSTSLTL